MCKMTIKLSFEDIDVEMQQYNITKVDLIEDGTCLNFTADGNCTNSTESTDEAEATADTTQAANTTEEEAAAEEEVVVEETFMSNHTDI